MSDADDARRRVEAFVADYHERWSRAGRNPMTWPTTRGPDAHVISEDQAEAMEGTFAAWRTEVDALEAEHGLAGWQSGFGYSLGSHPDHDPAAETVTAVDVARVRGTVRTLLDQPSHGVPRHHEFRLRRVDGDWRIERIVTTFDPPGRPVLEPVAARELLARATDDAELPELPAHVHLDVPGLFDETRRVVRRPGDLTTEGVLAVLDLGYVSGPHLAVLTRRVPAGTYAVEVASDGATNLAVRLVLSGETVVEHRPAPMTDGSSRVGVDTGQVAIADAARIVAAEQVDVEAAYQEATETLIAGGDVVHPLGGVVVNSGYGDGSYPAYWGLDADGNPAELVVDFVVAAEDVTRTTQHPFGVGRVGPLLVDRDGAAYVVSHDSDAHVDWRVLDPDGAVLVERGRLGSLVSGGRSSSTWTPTTPLRDGTIEVTEHLGYRHV